MKVRNKLMYACLYLLLFCTFTLKARNNVWKGQAWDENANEPLIGVSVVIKETSNATVSDLDGWFDIKQNKCLIEFLYRDAKLFRELTTCQVRGENKLNFHFNAALTAVNLAKIEWLSTRESKDEPFSMSNYKNNVCQQIIT